MNDRYFSYDETCLDQDAILLSVEDICHSTSMADASCQFNTLISGQMFIEGYEDELSHHGILGQKWGVRRTPEQLGHNIHKYSMTTKNVMLGKTPAKLYRWNDKNGEPVAEFKTWDWWDGKNISDLEINKKYRKNGYSYQLLDYATKKLGVKNLAVKKIMI